MKERFVRLGWHDGEYFVYDREYGIAYGFIYEPDLEEVERVAKEYEKDQLLSLAHNEPIDAHDLRDLPREFQEFLEEHNLI